jgi:hypothetical protein
MFTLIHHDDGRISLQTHVAPGRLSPGAASRLLHRLEPLLRELERTAGTRRSAAGSGTGPSTRPLEPEPAGPARPELDVPGEVRL